MMDPTSKGGEEGKRRSSFISSSSPYVRRNSFLSRDMIEHENYSVYESPSFYSDSSSYNIISLKECQGFIFNQDLFASPYQQSRSLAKEKKRALSYSRIKNSRQSSIVNSVSSKSASHCSGFDSKQRRHTSYHAARPALLLDSIGGDGHDNEDLPNLTATVFEDDEDGMDIDTEENLETQDHEDGDDDDDEEEDDDDDNDDDDNEEDDDFLDSAIVDDYEEDYEEMNEYGGDANNRRYKVQVTDIIINEAEADIFPS